MPSVKFIACCLKVTTIFFISVLAKNPRLQDLRILARSACVGDAFHSHSQPFMDMKEKEGVILLIKYLSLTDIIPISYNFYV